jgi:glycosyltransferase involved in cell wall biosynthesis
LGRFAPVILIPAFQEAATIGAVVAEAVKYAPVVVGDDRSGDDTAALAKAAGAEVRIHPARLGYSASLNALFDHALEQGWTHAVTMDADGEHDPRILPIFLSALERVPLVVGRRPRSQRFAEAVAALYVRRRYGIHDIFCGMKGYALDLVREAGGFDRTASVGTDLALHALRSGRAFEEVAVSGTPRLDRPRFGSVWRANKQLFAVLGRIIARDLKGGR